MGMLHKLLKAIEQAKNRDVADPRVLVAEAETEFKQGVADTVHALEDRIDNLQRILLEHLDHRADLAEELRAAITREQHERKNAT